MPKKPGNGGHGPEEYDVNTGKYVADGQPNKYYDNPKEKTIANVSHNLSDSMRDKLVDIFGDIFGETEFDDEINKMFEKPKTEKYTKSVVEMSQEELLVEIGEHKKWLVEYGISLKCSCLDNDLKLKCANFREMHRLFEKYPYFKHDKNGLKPPVEIIQRKMKSRYGDCSVVSTEKYSSYQAGLFVGKGIRFNSVIFNNYDNVVFMHGRDIKTKYHPDVNEDKIASSTFTHEFGHLMASYFIGESLSDYAKSKLNKPLDVYEYNKTGKELQKVYNDFHQNAFNEIFAIFLEDNPNLGVNDFLEEKTKYAKTNIQEWFAETFASLEGGKPTRTALAMEKWFSKKLNKENG